MRKLLRFPFFPFLAGLLPVLILWNFNKSQVYPRDVLLALVLTAGFVIVSWALALLLFRNLAKVSVASSLYFLLFFSYGHIYNLISKSPALSASIGFVKLAAGFLLLLALTTWLAARVKRLPLFTVQLLNGVLAFLLVINLGQILAFEANRKRADTAVAKTLTSEETPQGAAAGEDLPDIYYIILDAYSRQDILQSSLNFDNSDFINGLRQRGFYVADCANSNYDETVSSVLSSLNYSYIEDGNKGTDGTALDLKNNRIRYDLKPYGYQFVSTKAFSSENDINNADIYLNYRTDQGMKDTMAQAQFMDLYLQTTLLRTAFELYRMDPVRYNILPGWLFVSNNKDDVLGYASFWYYQTKYVFDTLADFPQRPGNFLIYAHINAPHGPYVFDRNGNFKYTYNPEDNAPYYLEQVEYVNKRVLELVDALIIGSDVPPIILLQADHGAHVLTSGMDKHKILSAYYLPGAALNDLYETITPVNTFRLILRDYFDRDIQLLPDSILLKSDGKLESVPSTCPVP